MRKLYLSVIVGLGVATLLLGGCNDDLALCLGSATADDETPTRFWSTNQTPLKGQADEQLYTAEEIMAMMTADNRETAYVDGRPLAVAEIASAVQISPLLPPDELITLPEEAPFKPTAITATASAIHEVNLPDLLDDFPEMADLFADKPMLPTLSLAAKTTPPLPLPEVEFDFADGGTEWRDKLLNGTKNSKLSPIANADADDWSDFADRSTETIAQEEVADNDDEVPLDVTADTNNDHDSTATTENPADAINDETTDIITAEDVDELSADPVVKNDVAAEAEVAADDAVIKRADAVDEIVTDEAAVADAELENATDKLALPVVKEARIPVATPDVAVKELIGKEKIKQQALRAEADHHFAQGVAAFEAGHYTEALTSFDRALQVDPQLAAAAEYRTRARQFVGRSGGDQDAALLTEIVRNNEARLKERELRLNNGLERASDDFLRSLALDEVRSKLSRNEQIQLALVDLETAEQNLQAVQLLLQGSGLPREQERMLEMRSRALSAQITQQRQSLLDERGMLDRNLAEVRTRQARRDTEDQEMNRLNQMLTAAEYHLSRGEFDDARVLVEKVIGLDKTNRAALELRKKVRIADYQKNAVESEEDLRDSEENWAIDVQQAYILPRKTVVYPHDWERIRQRAQRLRTTVVTDTEEAQMLNKLRAITGNFEYVEQSLIMVINDFQQRAKITIVLSNGVNGEDVVPTSGMRDVTMLQMLDQIMADMKLGYKYEDQALVIYPADMAAVGTPVLQVYAVGDIIKKPRKFKVSTRLASTMLKQDQENDNPWGDAMGNEEEEDTEPFALVEYIKNTVGTENDWAEPRSVALWERSLIVFNTPAIQAIIERVLEEWRSSNKQQVLVEGRFMEISDAFFEAFGFGFGGSKVSQNTAGSKQLQAGIISSGSVPDSFRWGPATVSDDPKKNRYGGISLGGNLMSATDPLNYALNTLRLNMTINAAQKTNKGSILHNPKVLVRNGTTAFCQSIVDSQYIRDYTPNTNVVMPIMGTYQQGVIWEVRPVISFDRKYITVRVHPEILKKVDPTDPDFRDLGFKELQPVKVTVQGAARQAQGGNNNNNNVVLTSDWLITLEKPITNVTDFWTNATVPDGGTIMVGGLLRDGTKDSVSGIPVLSSIPYLGRLTRTDSKERDSRNNIIMLSAKIIDLED